jgi:hypothetical protein
MDFGLTEMHDQVVYNKELVLALLSFWDQLATLRKVPLERLPAAASGQSAVPDLQVDPGQPINLSERVLHAFAQHNLPIYKPLSLPVTWVTLFCPGAC